MIYKLKTTLLYLFMCIHAFLFSQEKENFSKFKYQINQQTKSFSSNLVFDKTRTFFIQDEWDSTLVYTSKILSLSPTNKNLIDYCYFFRGFSFFEKKLFKEAENELLKISNQFVFQPDIKAKLGSIALEKLNFAKALSYYKEVENLPAEKRYTININNLKHNIGLCYLHLEKFSKAEVYLKESVDMQEKSNDTIQLIGSYGDIATLYYQQYKDAQAIPYFQKAYQLAKTTDDYISRQNTAQNMAVVEENRKDYKKALQYRKEYEQWRDSINDQNRIYATAKAEKKIAVEKEQKQVAVLKAKNEVQEAQRNTFLYSAIILLLLLITSFYFYREKVKSNKIINTQKENLDELNATKDKLFSIVSHDLRSSVNAIKTSNKKLINNLETQDIDKVKSLLHKNSSIVNSAYNLLDNLLNWAMLQAKQSFFQITKLRLASIVEHVLFNYKAILVDKEISFSTKVDKKTIVYADQESLKIILRNLIDNAIKFSNPKGAITIYIENDDSDFCQLIIEDTGIGMDNETREELLKETTLLYKKKHEEIIGTGLGIQLCKSMVKKNKGMFSIESEHGKGTKMIISLPKNLPNG